MYFDNSATTRTRREVISVMRRYFRSAYGNPSSVHKKGMAAKAALEIYRERVAFCLGAESEEIVFTGSGSEGNNTAIHSALKTTGRNHIISSRIEHSSIFNTLERHKDEGVRITYIPVDGVGRYDLNALKVAIDEDTALVSLSYANNEIGTVQDMPAIVETVKGKDVLLHIDAVQALPYFRFDLRKLGADFVVFSGHKLYAPKGVGILYRRKQSDFCPLIRGGGQERDHRSGTENVPYIAGISKALELNDREKDRYFHVLKSKRDRIISFVLNHIDGAVLTGDPESRVPNLASFAVRGINSKALVRLMAEDNVEISSGSACSSAKDIPSRVLDELKFGEEYVNGSIRISLGKYNTDREIGKMLTLFKRNVERLRNNADMINLESSFISQHEFRDLVTGETELQVIDVRPIAQPPLDIEARMEIPLWKLKTSMRMLEKEKPVVVICFDGDLLARMAQSSLIKLGFTQVKVLAGGFNAYQNLFM